MAVCLFFLLSGAFTAVLGLSEATDKDDIIGMAFGATLAFIFLVMVVFLIWIGAVWQKWYREIQRKKGRVKISERDLKYEKELKRLRKAERKRALLMASSDVSIRDVPKYIYAQGGANNETQSVTMEVAGRPSSNYRSNEIQERSLDLGFEDPPHDAVIRSSTYIETGQRSEVTRGSTYIETGQRDDETAIINKAFSVLDDEPKPVHNDAVDDAILIL